MPRAAKRSTRRRSGRSRRSRPRRRWGRWLVGLGLLAVLALGFHVLSLSHRVRVQFEGKRWSLPARVYAQPLALYEGARVTPARLRQALQALGYRQAARADRPGRWHRSGQGYRLHTRGFRFWDGQEPPRRVEVRFAGGAVSALRALDGRAAPDILRLEPVEIGSFHPVGGEDRVLLRRDQLPDHLVKALLAVEDRHFYQHHGIDLMAIARAAWADLRARKAVQGGSTLTQQLAKNFFLTPERSLARKLDEALIALILEARYTKDEILEAYANEVYLGQDGSRAIHGFGLAARFYFGRPLQELEVAQTALLVGLLKGASYYNPRRHPQRALERRNLVLDLMARQGAITPKAAARAKRRPLGVVPLKQARPRRHAAFLDLVKRQLRRDYREEDLLSEGLRIFTTLDPWVQRQVDREVAAGLRTLERRKGFKRGTLEAAMVVVDPQAGEVKALSGGRRADYAGFNRALDAVRPIGSLVKPAVYLLALTRPDRYTLITELDDSPLTLRDARGRPWRPKNYDGRSHGRVPLHKALAHSWNLATVHLGLDLGLKQVAAFLRRLGVERRVRPLPSLLLGSLSLSPWEVAGLYQVFASGGFRSPLRAIRAVTDAEGRPLRRYPLEVEKVAEAGPLFLLERNLVEVMREGTGRGIRRFLPAAIQVAGKTGTTNDLRDSWFAGYSADWLAVVWVGRDDNEPAGLSGAGGALRLWGRVMQKLSPASLEPRPPAEVAYYWIDPDSGQLSAEHCPGALAMPFIRGSQPRQWDSCAAPETRSDFPFD